MKIHIETDISDKYNDEIKITIQSNQINDKVQQIIHSIETIDDNYKKIIGTQNNNIFIINIDEIICFYSENKNNYCKTSKGIFKIKQPLYELENNLTTKDFIRISNSSIININHVAHFNTDITGTIKVQFKDGNIEYISRRRISKVMKLLREGL